MQCTKQPEKYLIFIFTEEITIHHTPNPFSDDEGNKNPKTMDDTDPTPDVQMIVIFRLDSKQFQ